MHSSHLLLLSLISLTRAQAPSGTSICDFYAAKQTSVNSTEGQRIFIEGFVANVFGGNSSVFQNAQVPGILSAGTYNGKEIRLAKYFDGTRYSTQSKQGQPQAVNWMDDGGAITLASGRIANSNTSNQYKLLSRFASLFARVMQCTSLIASNYTSNLGQQHPNLYQVHKFMALDPNELGWFIENVGLAARSVGISEREANIITSSMSRSLNLRCLPPIAVLPGGPVAPQGLCTDATCELAPNAACTAYDFPNGISPEPALVNGESDPTSSATPTAASKPKKKSIVLPIAIGVAVPVGLLLIALVAWLIIRSRKKVSALESRLGRVEETSGHGYGPSSDKASYMVAQSETTPTLASPGLHRERQASGSFCDPHTSTYIHHSPDSRPFSGEPFNCHSAHVSTHSQSRLGGIGSAGSPSIAVSSRPDHPPQEMA